MSNIKIIKEESELGTLDITLQQDEDRYLDIGFGGTGDTYWRLVNTTLEEVNYDTFIISKKDYDIYAIFDELYNDIINAKVYIPHLWEETIDDHWSTKEFNKREIKRVEEANTKAKNNRQYQMLCKDGIITYVSDEGIITTSDTVKISKKEDSYFLEFIRHPENDDPMSCPGIFTIRFRHSGSRYEPFDSIFWRHFDNLQSYEPNKQNNSKTRKKI